MPLLAQYARRPVHGVSARLRGERASVARCLSAYARRLLPVLGVALVIGFVFLPCWIAWGLLAELVAPHFHSDLADALSLVVAGAALSCLFWVAVPVAAVESRGVVASLRRSLELTRGARGRVFLISLLTLAIQVGPLLAFEDLLRPYGGWAVVVVAILTGVPGAVACAVGYLDLKAEPGTDDLVRAFA